MLNNFFTAVLLMFALASGCASTGKTSAAPRPTKNAAATVRLQDAQDLEKRGKFLDAGLAYAQLANRANPPEKQDLQFKATEVFLRGSYTQQAEQTLADLDPRGLNISYAERKQLLLAQTELARGKRERALSILDTLVRSATLELTRISAVNAKIQIHIHSNALVEAARDRLILDGLLRDESARRTNQNLIYQNLVDAPESLLVRAKSTTPDPFSGWVELALITKSAQLQPAEAARLMSEWKARYPHHAGAQVVGDRFAARTPERVGVPQHLALLLPQQGNFAKAAEAVRDGFLAAYYSQPRDGFRPTIQIYDSGTNANDISGAYQRALRDGAQVIVGPLDKNAVNVLAQGNRLTVPTLALNYAEQNEAVNNLFQFGLSPEDEAAQTAERAWLDGHGRAAALIPEGAFGERLLVAFRERWLQLGGELVDTQIYSTKDNDISPPIKKLLDIDLSEQRRTLLKTTLGYDIKYAPRRRQDIDFVFVAAMPRHARMIRPQLNFHQANDLPVYSTSHVFSGFVNARTDHDIDNVTFGDMPWVLPKARRDTALNATITQLWPQQVENYMRLYAFGIDAFNLIPNLTALSEQRTLQHPGETGNLYMDDAHRVQRRLQWAEFKNGAPKLLE
ncbi:MAG: penicillin-binding protein activator [Gammaproteobacteria bacterium]|nr:penicillin-binding protein activator [Gammaproteobacteria bacterium]